jgi:hypothetical protein
MPDAPVIELERRYVGGPRKPKTGWRRRLRWLPTALSVVGTAFAVWFVTMIVVSNLQPDDHTKATPAEYLDATGLSWQTPQMIVDDPVGGSEDPIDGSNKLMFPVYYTLNGIDYTLEVPLNQVKGVPGTPKGGRIILVDDQLNRIKMDGGYWDCTAVIPRPSICERSPAVFDPDELTSIRNDPSTWIQRYLYRIVVPPDDLPPRSRP